MHFSSNTNGKQTAPHLSLMYGAPSCKREVGKTNEERAAAISVLVCRDVPLYKTNCKQAVTSIPPTQAQSPTTSSISSSLSSTQAPLLLSNDIVQKTSILKWLKRPVSRYLPTPNNTSSIGRQWSFQPIINKLQCWKCCFVESNGAGNVMYFFFITYVVYSLNFS